MADRPSLAGDDPAGYQAAEAASGSQQGRLNGLRAAVLGANDGIVSTAGIVIGVAGATLDPFAILTAGVAGLTAGALSMAVGEYVSVSAQRDTEKALLETERRELAEMPAEELAELAGLYEQKGLDPELALEVARQLHAHDALAAHAETELGINPDELTSPWVAAFSSAVSFTTGSVLPLLAIVLAPVAIKVPVTVAAVVAALVLTGYLSSRAGGTPAGRAIFRNVAGGLLAMAVTYGIGRLVGLGLG
ncbi:MAG: VIT family protein [Propionibacteriaceae bacterium]|jgi:VIT1/CCC1 family predicted Fe2+/Mn2+ transporter|nr:VIT family protein [Propionibacteriaceae bacterium]